MATGAFYERRELGHFALNLSVAAVAYWSGKAGGRCEAGQTVLGAGKSQQEKTELVSAAGRSNGCQLPAASRVCLHASSHTSFLSHHLHSRPSLKPSIRLLPSAICIPGIAGFLVNEAMLALDSTVSTALLLESNCLKLFSPARFRPR